MELSCQIQTPAILLPERARSPLKVGWVVFKAGLNILEGKNISGIFRELNHDSLVFNL
jgi:hypothetical protein